jgi:hypothetical protein
MAEFDRPRMVDLLGRLGAAADSVALEAARELDRMLGASGLSWDDLLRRDLSVADGDSTPEVADFEDAEGNDARSTVVSTAEMAEVSALIDRLLARANLSSATAENLTEMRRSIAERTFDAMDSRYVRALARRLGA